mgnify:CR=1 FL=1
MIIFPAIDLRDGKCVRLLRGDFAQETIYSSAPEEVALRWEREGAEYLHVVDLDGASRKTLRSSRRFSAMFKFPLSWAAAFVLSKR